MGDTCETVKLSSSHSSPYSTMFTALLLASSLCLLGIQGAVLPPGVSASACPNYPFCGPAPAAAPGAQFSAPQVPAFQAKSQALLAHEAAERAVITKQQFTGLVSPSGNIGPSGQCGPSGCVQF